MTTLVLSILLGGSVMASADGVDLSNAVVVTRGDRGSEFERNAATVLVEEVEKRTGIRWRISPSLPSLPGDTPAIVLAASPDGAAWSGEVPKPVRATFSNLAPEGFRAYSEIGKRPIVWAIGAEPRGVLYAAGYLLRTLDMRPQHVRLPSAIDHSTSPAYPLRGHQLGYRARANSYDAWDDRQFEQYIRELAIFGANAVENIPFQDRDSVHMKLPRRDMSRRLSEVCRKYDLEYWVWTPADFDLNDEGRRQQALGEHEQLYADCPRIDGVFVPGGDPGDNHPKLVMKFLADLAERLQRRHPKGHVWLSMQGYDAEEVDYVHTFIDEHAPPWLGGLVHGPSSPSLAETRRRLSTRYRLRHYPDITHTVRCQYPIPWWDHAFEVTLGREPVNPTPVYQAIIHAAFAPLTTGFISYSDGINDDVNKTVWTRLGWEPASDAREIVTEYARFFFGPSLAVEAADAILALERNWHGSLRTHGGVDATLALWRDLDRRAPALRDNWRWQMCQLRAHYDCYTRHRLIFESSLEVAANEALAEAGTRGPDAAMDAAMEILRRADDRRVRPELRGEIERLCEALFRSIGLQTSVERYQAAGAERGAVWDDVDYPLNNRWWLEDEFAAIRKLQSSEEKLARLAQIRSWENPGPGSFYDDVGNVAKSPHVLRGESPETDPLMIRNPNPTFHAAGKPRARQSWHSYMDWPIGVRYDNLDRSGTYVVRTTGLGECLLKIDGQRVSPTIDGKELGQIKEFPVPAAALGDGTLVLTFDVPHEAHLNWRQQSRLCEVWLLKR